MTAPGQPGSEADHATLATRVRWPTQALSAAGVALVAHQLFCKSLLFRNLEYTASDLYGLLDQSWSWLYTGRLLEDSAYGSQAAIHNYYLLPILSPLTLGLGAYGFFVVVALLQLVAAVGLAKSRAVETPGRIAALAGLVSPLAFYALDDPGWGFHPELLYPALAVLLALALLERRRRQALLVAAATVLVKEDGALVCGGVLAAHFARQLWLARATGVERGRIVRRAAIVLGATAVVFVVGMVGLWWLGDAAATAQPTASERVGRSWRVLARTLGPGAPASQRAALLDLVFTYAATSALLLLPLGARLRRGLALLAVSAPPVVGVLIVSGAHYKFIDPLLAQRVATLLALAVACVVLAGAAEPSQARSRRLGWSVVSVLLLAAASWALQLGLLARFGYALGKRANPPLLWSGRGSTLASLPREEVRFWHCLAGGLPGGTPVAPVPEVRPFFHRQSIVFWGLEERAARRPRVRVYRAEKPVARRAAGGSCLGPPVRDLVLEMDCELLPLVKSCGSPTPRVGGQP